jgi:hypothetical protein
MVVDRSAEHQATKLVEIRDVYARNLLDISFLVLKKFLNHASQSKITD